MTAWLLIAQLALTAAQPSAPPPAAANAPWLVEAGGYAWGVTNDLGTWRGVQLQARWRGHDRVIPAVFVETQTRPAGTQLVTTMMATLNMTPRVYAVTSVSLGTSEAPAALFYPERRFDGKVHVKLPRDPRTVLGTGYTRFELGAASGDIYNAGVLIYRRRLIVEANGFLNVSHPGSLTSTAASVAFQYGEEKTMWTGVAVGAGRELYRASLTPEEVSLRSVTVTGFVRRWFSSRTGIHLTLEYQDKHDAWRRAGLGARFFWEF